ncbi:MAG: isochorismatase family protein [Parvibaculaceae bacterium]
MNKPYNSKNLLSVETTTLLVVDCQSDLDPGSTVPVNHSAITTVERVVKSARALSIPIISTIYSANGAPPAAPLSSIAHLNTVVRANINPWEDDLIRTRISDVGRDKIVILGSCAKGGVSFAALGALETGYQPYIVVDAIHSASQLDASTALTRMLQAGAISLTGRQVMLEWGR